jgi:hypothetical protein
VLRAEDDEARKTALTGRVCQGKVAMKTYSIAGSACSSACLNILCA